MEEKVQSSLAKFKEIHALDPLQKQAKFHELIEKYCLELLALQELPPALLLAANCKHLGFHSYKDSMKGDSVESFNTWRKECIASSWSTAQVILEECQLPKEMIEMVGSLVTSELSSYFYSFDPTTSKWMETLNDATILSFLTFKVSRANICAESRPDMIMTVLEFIWPKLSSNGIMLCKKIGLERVLNDFLFQL